MASACIGASQFVHVPEDDIRCALRSVYEERAFHNDPHFKRKAAADQIVVAFEQGLIAERVFSPKGAISLICSLFGRSCMICHGLDRNVGSSVRMAETPAEMFPTQALRLDDSYRVSAFQAICGGDLKLREQLREVCFPRPICGPCWSFFGVRAAKIPADATDAERHSSWMEILADLLTKPTALQRISDNNTGRESHRFELTYSGATQ